MIRRRHKSYEDEEPEVGIIGTGSVIIDSECKKSRAKDIKIYGFVRPKEEKTTNKEILHLALSEFNEKQDKPIS